MLDIERLGRGELPPGSAADWLPRIEHYYLIDEAPWLAELARLADPGPEARQRIAEAARGLVETLRRPEHRPRGMDALLQQYHLSSQEGRALMELAEALLRIPDAATAQALIRDRLGALHFSPGEGDDLRARLGRLGLAFGERLLADDSPASGVFQRLLRRTGEPWLRRGLMLAMRELGQRFVLGQTLEAALARRRSDCLYSLDMLGEAALTEAQATGYAQAYSEAIRAADSRTSVSIKLSALHPRYEPAQRERVLAELEPRLLELAMLARERGVALSIDAEESDRLMLSLELYERLLRHPQLHGWEGLGMVVQAYSRRCLPVLVWLARLAEDLGSCLPVRLVKGAYWDAEIKLAQQRGLDSYPVFTRKAATDVAYLACASFLLGPGGRGRLYPQFATHNAHTLCSLLDLAEQHGQPPFEVQRLQGMGEELHDLLPGPQPRRIYAPIGAHRELLPYLVRRLLENGANASFVHRLLDPQVSVETLVEHPLDTLLRQSLAPRMPSPAQLGNAWLHAAGLNLDVGLPRQAFFEELEAHRQSHWQVRPLIDGEAQDGAVEPLFGPWNRQQCLGSAVWSEPRHVRQALDVLERAAPGWRQTPVAERAALLERFGERLQAARGELVALLCREAGKTLQDALDELREAIDYCRYYARQARELFVRRDLPGPVGELNQYYYEGRGIALCVSPWNFPLAIFLGQVCAALVAGNVVVAKPAERTSLIAARAIELLLEAGLPPSVIALLPGSGARLGRWLCRDPRVASVCFTGSFAAARQINLWLAEREGPLAGLIAETGGQNALIADSSALPEQLVRDVLGSAFVSAGQRCSALRVLCLQEEIAEPVIEMLRGAMAELRIGEPLRRDSELGPLIDGQALERLAGYAQRLEEQGRLLAATPLPEGLDGFYLAPRLFELDSVDQLGGEQFGPLLHLVRYKAGELDALLDALNATGYGLTLAVHSRNRALVQRIEARLRVGNVYVNRNQVGAVVGVQPFGGMGLSGSGPKAGGPDYLRRLSVERCTSFNTAAVGGDPALLALSG